MTDEHRLIHDRDHGDLKAATQDQREAYAATCFWCLQEYEALLRDEALPESNERTAADALEELKALPLTTHWRNAVLADYRALLVSQVEADRELLDGILRRCEANQAGNVAVRVRDVLRWVVPIAQIRRSLEKSRGLVGEVEVVEDEKTRASAPTATAWPWGSAYRARDEPRSSS